MSQRRGGKGSSLRRSKRDGSRNGALAGDEEELEFGEHPEETEAERRARLEQEIRADAEVATDDRVRELLQQGTTVTPEMRGEIFEEYVADYSNLMEKLESHPKRNEALRKTMKEGMPSPVGRAIKAVHNYKGKKSRFGGQGLKFWRNKTTSEAEVGDEDGKVPRTFWGTVKQYFEHVSNEEEKMAEADDVLEKQESQTNPSELRASVELGKVQLRIMAELIEKGDLQPDQMAEIVRDLDRRFNSSEGSGDTGIVKIESAKHQVKTMLDRVERNELTFEEMCDTVRELDRLLNSESSTAPLTDVDRNVIPPTEDEWMGVPLEFKGGFFYIKMEAKIRMEFNMRKNRPDEFYTFHCAWQSHSSLQFGRWDVLLTIEEIAELRTVLLKHKKRLFKSRSVPALPGRVGEARKSNSFRGSVRTKLQDLMRESNRQLKEGTTPGDLQQWFESLLNDLLVSKAHESLRKHPVFKAGGFNFFFDVEDNIEEILAA